MKKKIYTLLLIVFFSIAQKAYAQQTVFNVPSADVTEKGHVFLQQEAQFRGWNPGAFFNGTTFSAVGIGHNTELTGTLFNVSAPASENITLGAGFKTAMPITALNNKYPQREFKFTVGTELLTSLEGQGVGAWTYAHLSGRVPKLNTRLTAGMSYNSRLIAGRDVVCFIAAVEQPITPKTDLLMDWYSGSEHFTGFLVVGGSYKLPKNVTLYAGYQIPNHPENGKSGIIIQLAKIF